MLTDKQVQEVSATGAITFDEANLRLIRRHYPAAGNRAGVIAATFNDNTEDFEAELHADCFWVAPAEIAVTLKDTCPADKSPFVLPNDEVRHTEEELRLQTARHIRISPHGIIYHEGRVITFDQASAMITEMSEIPATPQGIRSLTVVLPPPLSERDLAGLAEKPDRTPRQIFDSLASQGSLKGVSVWGGW